MFANEERKLERMNSGISDTVSENIYNLIIGACVLYGLVMNALLVSTCGEMMLKINPIVVIIGYFVLVIIGSFMANSKSAVVSFIGYNFIAVPVGLLLSISIPTYSYQDISVAVGITAIIVAIMLLVSTLFPHYFIGLGKTLFITLFITIIVEFIALLLGFKSSFIDFIVICIFTLYVGFDWSKAQAYPKTMDNAIDSAIDIYLDIINLFIRILRIIGKSKD